MPAQEGISAEYHAHILYGARTWEIFGRQIFEIFRVSGEYKITSFQFVAAVQRGNKNFLKELQTRKKRSKLGQIYDKFSDVIAQLDDQKNEIFVCYNGENEEKKALNLIKNSNAKPLSLKLKELVNFISSNI